MREKSKDLAQQLLLLSKMQDELKSMLFELQQQQANLVLQQEELRQYQGQVIRSLAIFRLLLEQAQKGQGE